ncbi:hypothetical protein ACJDT4_19730 [Clostridium neuense]|uniref:Uncharacterized protein n=1 Tax=Clostridium neuense TaxID=1728934 RepID=A0ABW8TJA1_9CLOT
MDTVQKLILMYSDFKDRTEAELNARETFPNSYTSLGGLEFEV